MSTSIEELNEKLNQLNIKVEKLLRNYEEIRDEEIRADLKDYYEKMGLL